MPLEQIITTSGQMYELQREPDCKFITTQSQYERISMAGKGRYRFKGILAGDIFKAYEITRLN